MVYLHKHVTLIILIPIANPEDIDTLSHVLNIHKKQLKKNSQAGLPQQLNHLLIKESH